MRSGLIAATLLLLPMAACDLPGGDPSPDPALEALAKALERGEVAGVAFTTGDAATTATAVLEGVQDLGPQVEAGDVEADGATATGQLRWSWPAGAETWEYDAPVELALRGEAWHVVWDPRLVEPSLKDGEVLASTTLRPKRGDILGQDGQPIVTERTVVRFGIDKTRVPAARAVASARRLAQRLGIDVASYVDRVAKAGPRAFVEALVLREPQARTVEVEDIVGAGGVSDEIPLAPTREFAAPILGDVGPVTAEMVEKSDGELEAGDVAGLSGLQARYDEHLAGTPGMQIEAVAGEGEERTLFSTDEVDGEPLRTTLASALQAEAERLLASVGPPSALVAIRPSTGEILAAASGPGSKGVNTATFARHAPGSTFKAVTALALLRRGVGPDDQVRCTPEVVVDGKAFENYDDYPPGELGTIALREAVAHSCNTALIGSRDRLQPGDLAAAAAALGLGVDHDLGFPAYFGQVPPPASETELAADMIGQGKVLASPMAMATVAASVAAGRTVLPVLLPDHEVEQEPPSQPLSGREVESLRAMLRGVVEEGSGAFLADVPGPPVLAKTGTAEYGTGAQLRTHAWMIGAQGDLAVAVFVETGESGSGTAGPLLEGFLRAAR